MINVQNLNKTFQKTIVLNALNLKIMPEQRVALVGQNGCGKTTLIRCLLGLYQFEGEIDVFGINIKKNREEALKKIAFVPQTPPALKGSVSEIIALTAELCGFSPNQVEVIASELGLEISKCKSRTFKNLSGGMKQKLLIAIALTRKPSMIILDEPTANLDPKARAVFFKLLSELPKETTMLLTSHRIDELSGIVSRVIELDNGSITMDDIVEARGNDILTGQSQCVLELNSAPDSVKCALTEWGFVSHDTHKLHWSGKIASADSFRFHATLTRWSGIINKVHLDRMENKENF